MNPTKRQIAAAMAFYSGEPIPKKTERKKNARPEAAILAAVLAALRNHPRVAWIERMNSGAIKTDDRFIRYGFRGCSDIIGQLKGGRILAVEVKAPGGRLTPEQCDFLDLVTRHGGLAFVARSADDVLRTLA
ncbi:MAG: VRR-NUC domain-containing protein [Burkholderiales bacterium]|nr:VRR-NUC domain-containing protein [Burkholderiales bacterium]